MIIGICGGTGSGKTTIARKIIKSVGDDSVILIEQDSYYRNLADIPLDERHEANFDHPDAIDSELLRKHIRQLKNGETVEIPIYDYATHIRKPETERIEPKPVVLVEGILIFAQKKIRELLDIRIFVDTPDDVRFTRRLRRDIAERGRTVESVIRQYYKTVRPMHFEFVEPSKSHADIIIPEGGNINIGIELLSSKIREVITRPQSSAGSGGGGS